MKRFLIVVALSAVVAAGILSILTIRFERQTREQAAEAERVRTEVAGYESEILTLEELEQANEAERARLFPAGFATAAHAARIAEQAEAASLEVERLTANPDAGTIAVEVSGPNQPVLQVLTRATDPDSAPHLITDELSVSATETGRVSASLVLRLRRAGDQPLLQPPDALAVRTGPAGWPVAPLPRIAGALAPPPRPAVERAAGAGPITGSPTAPAIGATSGSGPLAATQPGSVPTHDASSATPPVFIGTMRVDGESHYGFRISGVVRTITPGDAAFGWTLTDVASKRFLFEHEGVSYEVIR